MRWEIKLGVTTELLMSFWNAFSRCATSILMIGLYLHRLQVLWPFCTCHNSAMQCSVFCRQGMIADAYAGTRAKHTPTWCTCNLFAAPSRTHGSFQKLGRHAHRALPCSNVRSCSRSSLGSFTCTLRQGTQCSALMPCADSGARIDGEARGNPLQPPVHTFTGAPCFCVERYPSQSPPHTDCSLMNDRP